MRGSGILLPIVGLLGAGPAGAADLDLTEFKASTAAVPYISAPAWSVVGSISPTFTDNALFTRDNRKSDIYYEPDVSVRLDGNLTNDLSYRLYARTQYEAFSREKDSNFAVARDFRAGSATFSPLLLLTYRFSDLAEARRWRFDAVLGIEVKLDPRWSIVSTPLFEAYWFTDGLNSGRRDQLYSADVGLKYNFASNVSLTTTVLYEARTSNVPLRRYRDVRIGPRLDFAF